MKKLALLIIAVATMICLASCERAAWKLPSEWAVNKVSEEIDGDFVYSVSGFCGEESLEAEDEIVDIYKVEVILGDELKTYLVRIDYHYDDSFFSKIDRFFTDSQMIPRKCITRIDDYEIYW